MGYLSTEKTDSQKVDLENSNPNTEGTTGENILTHSSQQLQLMADQSNRVQVLQKKQEKANNTGLPDQLKSGIEHLSGHSMDDVKVNYNSSKPAEVNAHAYAQGSEIHLANGQEKHLAHEAWHVVQQKELRVKPTTEVNGTKVNDNKSLESEADSMGQKSVALSKNLIQKKEVNLLQESSSSNPSQVVSQLMAFQQFDYKVDQSDEEAETTVEPEIKPEPEPDPETEDKKEKNNSESYIEKDGVISGTGITYRAKYDFGNKKGEIDFTGPNKIFSGKAQIKDKGEEYEVSASTPISNLSTPKFQGSMPLARIPLGIPGVFAAIDLDYGSSASLGGGLGFKFNLDNKMSNATDFQIENTNLTAVAQAKIGVFGGVAAGLPGVAQVKVGGAGTAEATLKSKLKVDSDFNMSGSIEGEAKGKLEAVAQAKLLWYTKTASVPIVEGTLGKFEKKFVHVPLSLNGLKDLASISSYKFTRDKGDSSSAESKAIDNAENDPEKFRKA